MQYRRRYLATLRAFVVCVHWSLKGRSSMAEASVDCRVWSVKLICRYPRVPMDTTPTLVSSSPSLKCSTTLLVNSRVSFQPSLPTLPDESSRKTKSILLQSKTEKTKWYIAAGMIFIRVLVMLKKNKKNREKPGLPKSHPSSPPPLFNFLLYFFNKQVQNKKQHKKHAIFNKKNWVYGLDPPNNFRVFLGFLDFLNLKKPFRLRVNRTIAWGVERVGEGGGRQSFNLLLISGLFDLGWTW